MTGPPSPLLIVKLYCYTKQAAVNILPMTIKGIWSHREQHILETRLETNVFLSAFSSAPELGRASCQHSPWNPVPAPIKDLSSYFLTLPFFEVQYWSTPVTFCVCADWRRKLKLRFSTRREQEEESWKITDNRSNIPIQKMQVEDSDNSLIRQGFFFFFFCSSLFTFPILGAKKISAKVAKHSGETRIMLRTTTYL